MSNFRIDQRPGCRCRRGAADETALGALGNLPGYARHGCGACGSRGCGHRPSCTCGACGSGHRPCGACPCRPCRSDGCREDGCTFPFYTGPCAPGCEYPSPDYPMPCRSGACPHPYDVSYDCGCGEYAGERPCRCARAVFRASAPLCVCAGCAVPLVCDDASGCPDYAVSGGAITFGRAGCYFLSLAVAIPRDAALVTTLRLLLDGEAIPGAVIDVDTTGASCPANLTVSAAVRAEAGAVLTLVSTEALTLATAASPVFTLTSLAL